MHPIKRIGFRFAMRGFWLAHNDYNMRIHLVSVAVVAFLAVVYGVTGAGLGVVVLSAAIVVAMEIVNTAIEQLCNLVDSLNSLGENESIRNIKDLAAGAVLVVSIGALANGIIVFGPKLI